MVIYVKRVGIAFLIFICVVIYGMINIVQIRKDEKDIVYIDFPQEKTESTVENTDTLLQKEKKEKIQKSSSKAKPNLVRILIKSGQYASLYHEELFFCSEAPILYLHHQQTEVLEANKTHQIKKQDIDTKKVSLMPTHGKTITFLNIKRQDQYGYEGKFDCFRTKEGIALVNELPMERYLTYVIPSEMPASYPKEALKAQAVVARSYAYAHMEQFAYPQVEGHMDDSTSFQVYHNIKDAPWATQAVEETKNQVLWYQGKVKECMYFATSAGICTTEEADFKQQIDTIAPYDYEYQESWYRWHCQFSLSWNDLYQRILHVKNLSEEEKKICQKSKKLEKILVDQRDEQGRVWEILVKTDAGSILINDQYVIRCLLAKKGTKVTKQDDSVFMITTILPSPFFYIEKQTEKKGVLTLQIKGGGFGHGIGMSQNGAKQMALQGKSCEEILRYYYH